MAKQHQLETHEVQSLLRERYKGLEWAYLEEVRNGTGGDATRSCDAMAMGLWPSKGLHLHGHEIKVSRGDWRKEINDPSKSHAFIKWCHFWWIVAPKNMISISELPATWGLMEATKSALRIKRPATLHNPEMISYSFLGALLRRQTAKDEIKVRLEHARRQGYEEGYKNKAADSDGNRALMRAQRELEGIRKTVRSFELASGLRMTQWDAGNVGEAVRILRRLDLKKVPALKRMASDAVDLIKAIKSMDLDKLEQQE